MTDKPFQVGALPPPNFPEHPPGPPQDPPDQPRHDRRRRRLQLAAAAGVGAVTATVAAAVITVQVRNTTPTTIKTTSPVTITMPAPPPLAPVPLPTAQADRQTCQQGWLASVVPINAATDALAVLPNDITILDPAVHANAEWTAAVNKAGNLYRQASDTLEEQIAPGTTSVLAEASNTAIKALRLLGDSYSSFDPISGNAHNIATAAADQMAALCMRLAP